MFNIIELTEEEQALFDCLPMNIDDPYEKRIATLESMAELADSLLERKVIPNIRLRFFTDPELNIGTRMSRQEALLRNARSKVKMMRHPHFWKYLLYFIQGPGLTDSVINAFVQKVEACDMVTSGDVIPLGQLARQLVRNHGLEREKAAEDFFKLALELDLIFAARHIRNAVMQLGTAYDNKIRR